MFNGFYKQSEGTAARRRVMLHCVDVTDGMTAETGEAAGQPQISKAGGTFSNTTSTLVAIGNGRYYVELTATELDTFGKFDIRYKSANTAEAIASGQVVAFDPASATDLGLSSISAIKTKTDQLIFTIANKVDASIQAAGDFAQAAADKVWSTAARTLTAFGFSVTVGTNNDKTGYGLSSAAVQAIWDALTSALTTAGSIGKRIVDNLDVVLSTRATPAQVQTSVAAELDLAGSELSAVPTTTGTLRQKINFIFQYLRNKRTVTSATETLFKEDASTALGTSTVSDDGTTFTHGEVS